MAANDTRSMTDEQFVELLREMDDPGVTIYEFCRAVGCSFCTIYRRFGSWPALRERAGLPGRGRRGAPRVYDADGVREAFRRVVREVGPGVTKTEFGRRTGISDEVVRRLFGGWSELRGSEGLGANRRHDGASPEAVRAAFRQFVKSEGPELTLARFHELSGYGESVVRRCFGNWRALRESEGVTGRATKPERPVIPDEELIAEYRRVEAILKRRPTFRALGHLSFYGAETFRKRFELFRWRSAIRDRCEEVAERRGRVMGRPGDGSPGGEGS